MDAKKLAALLQNLDAQSFRPGDSLIASTINHPVDAVSHGLDWLTKNVNTAAGIPEQYDNPTPWLAPSPDQQTQAAGNIAGLAQLGAFPFAPESKGGTVGTFIGPKAATWDAEKAATASKLLDEGVDPAQVWREHLIGRMPDNSLFSEIDDSLAKYVDNHIGGSSPGYADQLYQHPTLFNEYPELKEIALQHQPGKNGSFDFSNNKMTIGLEDADNVAPHEFQHAIQQREGWARGGSPSQIKMQDWPEEYKTKYDDLQNQISALRGANNLSGVKPLMDETTRTSREAAFKAYERLTGEAQARATQDRMNMDMQQRRENYPLAGDKLSDIPLDQLIYRYGAQLLPPTMLGYGLLGDKEQNKNALIEALRNGY